MNRLALACIFGLSLRAQEFDAAAIRPASPNTPSQCKGGPGTDDPGRLVCQNFPLSYFVMMAYDLRAFQYQGPDWMRSTRFDVQAAIPAGATVAQFRTMLQNLLASRFKLAVHHASKEMDAYDLVVFKQNPNLKRVEDDGSEKEPIWRPPAGGPPVRVKAQFFAHKWSTTILAAQVSNQLGRPVDDATHLDGVYDFTLGFMYDPAGQGPAAVDDNGVSIGDALKEQLGLALVKKKTQVDIVIVDHSEKTPNEN